MKALGIVAEYNPFHNGHKYHIETAKTKSGADICVAIMSGDFTQRGLPAVQDKWTRASWALNNGIDLVLELPTIYATSDAGHFTKGGITLLEMIGVEYIAFGIDEDEDKLNEIFKKLQTNKEYLKVKINELMKEGYSYPKARSLAIGLDEVTEPNSVLALGYLENLKSAKPIMIPRKGTGYNETNVKGLPSATAIRDMFEKGEDFSSFVPSEVSNILQLDKDKIWEMAISKALEMSSEEIDQINSADEGFGNLIKKVARYTSNYDDLVESLKSKRYTKTRIQRFVMQLILGIKREDVNKEALYIRPLGFNDKGASFLKELKKKEIPLPIITNINKNELASSILEKDIHAVDVFNIIYGLDLYENSDYVKKPVKL